MCLLGTSREDKREDNGRTKRYGPGQALDKGQREDNGTTTGGQSATDHDKLGTSREDKREDNGRTKRYGPGNRDSTCMKNHTCFVKLPVASCSAPVVPQKGPERCGNIFQGPGEAQRV